jgi:release factor glutamine methyltransferase
VTVLGIPTLRELMEAGAIELRGAKGAARENPRREASALLQAAVGLTRAQLLARGNEIVRPVESSRFWDMVENRARGVPLQLILGQTEFHEVSLKIEAGVFIPRPETELLVEEARGAVEARLPGPVRVLDLGTGTGAIAVAIAAAFRERREVSVFAGDWSPVAVRLARRNIEDNGVAGRVDVRRSDLFSAFADLEGKVDVLVSNPPYISLEESEALPLEVRLGDPEEALVDPGGGTGFHRRIASRGRDFLRPAGVLMMEIGETQGEAVESIVTAAGYEEVRIVRDWNERDRFVVGNRGGERAESSTRSS